MSLPLDELYFRWLYKQVGIGRFGSNSRSKTYWSLFRQFHKTEFVWFIPNDDNRVEDGKELRYEFIDDQHIHDVDEDWLQLGCSFLEMLVAFSRRLSFEADREPRDWFWELVENMAIVHCVDAYYDRSESAEIEVEEAVNRVIFRQYSRSGFGGLFPIEYAREDQRKIELWYQASAYISELEE